MPRIELSPTICHTHSGVIDLDCPACYDRSRWEPTEEHVEMVARVLAGHHWQRAVEDARAVLASLIPVVVREQRKAEASVLRAAAWAFPKHHDEDGYVEAWLDAEAAEIEAFDRSQS